MLFMVIERFKDNQLGSVGKRFQNKGRMLPDGVVYHASWMEANGARCFQIMEADDEQQLQKWIARWSDLVDFDVVPVLTSADFWSSRTAGR
jgi:hypothetical protein